MNVHPLAPLEINPDKEELVLFRDVKTLGIFRSPPSYHSIYRYAKYGTRSQSGVTVYLRYVDTPTGYATSRRAIIRFLKELNS